MVFVFVVIFAISEKNQGLQIFFNKICIKSETYPGLFISEMT